ncbi:YrdB family protein [Streptomyces sp. SID6673]|nr:YrdB family protein [Streptomyces sp. SID11726]NEB24413.1 YrdB family protein [Streptomyces sp. SID6673]
MYYLVAVVVFLIELVAFGAFASLGLAWCGTGVLGWVVTVILLVAVIAFWSLFMAPKASRRFGPVPYHLAKAVIYLAAAYALCRAAPIAALIFVVVAVISESLFHRHDIGHDGAARL